MKKAIINSLKKNERLKFAIKKMGRDFQYLASFHKRPARYYFYSWRSSLSKARRPLNSNNLRHQSLQQFEQDLPADMRICHDAISHPIIVGKEKRYSGGILVNWQTHRHIEEAMHLGDQHEPCQELPDLPDMNESDLREISQPVLFCGVLYNHFGHFLLESLGRLWAYESVKHLDPYIFFQNDMGYPDYLEKRNFIFQVLAGFGIPLSKVLFVNHVVRFKQMIVPLQKYGYGFRRSPDEIFIQSMRRFNYPNNIPYPLQNCNKIYVSRSWLSKGIVIGEVLFESYLQKEGYAIFHPEQYTLYEQLAIYSQAKKIIFCEGSAVHTCILLPDLKARVAVIARRQDPRWPCIEIIDQFLGYQQDALWIDTVIKQYQFGLETWDALARIDWYETGKQLKQHGFVEQLCCIEQENDFDRLTEKQIEAFKNNNLRK